MSVVDFILTVSALPVLGAASYLAALAALARRSSPVALSQPRLRFVVIVPAHNEENEIRQTVDSLLAVDYPRDMFRVLVVADNCSDRTADVASAAGAEVLVRQDLDHRGKGQALAFAFQHCLPKGSADAFVVVDADTIVSRNLLSTFSARFAAGAAVLQADYGVRNPLSSWRTRMMTIALASFHGVRSAARERLVLSCGLRGNGMGFSRAVLEAHPPQAFSIVEDLEYGLQLGYAQVRVWYVHEARVLGQMAVSEGASRSQRRRWERGRHALIRQHVPRLLHEAWCRRDLCLLDLALDLLVPPIGQLLMFISAGLLLSVAAGSIHAAVAPWLWAASLAAVAFYVIRGWAFSAVGIRGLFDLLWAPIYVMWKLTLRFRDRGRTPEEWVRTTREVRS